MPAIVWVVVVLAGLVAALLAVDWLTAGRTKGRLLKRAKDQSSDNADVGYAVVERQAQALRDQTFGR